MKQEPTPLLQVYIDLPDTLQIKQEADVQPETKKNAAIKENQKEIAHIKIVRTLIKSKLD